jgi:hypothetical protein
LPFPFLDKVPARVKDGAGQVGKQLIYRSEGAALHKATAVIFSDFSAPA